MADAFIVIVFVVVVIIAVIIAAFLPIVFPIVLPAVFFVVASIIVVVIVVDIVSLNFVTVVFRVAALLNSFARLAVVVVADGRPVVVDVIVVVVGS